MSELELMKTEIERRGATRVHAAERVLQSHPFLLDEDRAATKAYGLYQRLGIDAINIAHPATLGIGRERKIDYIYRGGSQTDRAPFQKVMESIRKLSAIG